VNDVAELKRFIVVHAKAQGLRPAAYQPVLDRIATDDDGAPDSWAVVWRTAGDALEAGGDLMAAYRRYVVARFPFVDGPSRALAVDRYAQAFASWAAGQRDIEPLKVHAGEHTVPCWATGLSDVEPRPLVVICGGIVSVKEQWAPTLRLANRLGLAAVVTELPGVGENGVPYDADAWRLFPSIVDAVAGRADTHRTTALALSFSGHLALRAAVADQRITGVITAGAPVRAFFTGDWWRRLPAVTADTLAHLTGCPADELDQVLPGLALTGEQLETLDIPVRYLASLRDEVVPQEDVALLRRHVRDLRVQENDDVHGSPRHVLESRLWVVESLMRLTGRPAARTALVGAVRRVLRGIQHRRSHD
jgi:hypothetical protein